MDRDYAARVSAAAEFHAAAMLDFPKGSELWTYHRREVMQWAQHLMAGLAR
jgi:hypothetical protein